MMRRVAGSSSGMARSDSPLGPFGRLSRCQHEAGGAIGEARLADALRAAEQPGVMHAAGAQAIEEGLLLRLMPDQSQGLARMRRARQAIGLVSWFAASGLRRLEQALANRRPCGIGEGVGRACRVEHDAACRLALRRWRGSPRAACGGRRASRSRSDRCSRPAHGGCAARGEPDLRVEIEDEGEVGHQPVDRHALPAPPALPRRSRRSTP